MFIVILFLVDNNREWIKSYNGMIVMKINELQLYTKNLMNIVLSKKKVYIKEYILHDSIFQAKPIYTVKDEGNSSLWGKQGGICSADFIYNFWVRTFCDDSWGFSNCKSSLVFIVIF